MKKKRSYRLKIPLKISIEGEDLQGARFREQCQAVNVSRDGACILSHHDLSVGSRLAIRVGGQVEGQAEVVWTEGGHHIPPKRLGIKFLIISEWIIK